MKISTRGRYAVRLMIDLAQHQADGFVPLKDVAERQDISKKYLEQIVNLLTKCGYIWSTRGYQGGYKLSKEPGEYTVAEILRATEGSITPVSCLECEENICPRSSQCLTLPMWKGLEQTISDYLDNITLEDLISDARDVM